MWHHTTDLLEMNAFGIAASDMDSLKMNRMLFTQRSVQGFATAKEQKPEGNPFGLFFYEEVWYKLTSTELEGPMPQKPKILIVEDDSEYHDMYARHLGEKIKIIPATTLEEGERLFFENPDIALVVMDACVPGIKLNSSPLVQKIRATFQGPIIAASRDPYFCLKLMDTGCTHSVGEGGKYAVPDLVCKILKIT